MLSHLLRIVALFGIVLQFGCSYVKVQPTRASEPVTLASPGGAVQVSVALKELPGSNLAGERLYYAIKYRGKDVLLDSPFGLDFKDSPSFARDLTIQDARRRTVNETWQRVWGKRKNVANHYNELVLKLEEANAPHRHIELVLRAYDDGMALRYVLPEQVHWGDFELAAERTAFRFPGNPTVWATNPGGFYNSQESEYVEMEMRALSPAEVYGCPLLVQVQPALWVAVTEADLTDWAGMHLTRAESEPNTIVTVLPRPHLTGPRWWFGPRRRVPLPGASSCSETGQASSSSRT